MPAPVAAEPPSPRGASGGACAPGPRRQPPGDLGRAYRIAFVETGTLEVVLPATAPVPVQQPARTAASAVVAAPSVPAQAERPLARRSRALLLGLAISVVLGVLAVVVTDLVVASLGLLPR